jgi:organic hydroperoxide reductase OsmC/OhrA
MSLREFLVHKRGALAGRRRQIETDPATAIGAIAASCKAGDRTGVRMVRVRDHRIASDSGPALGGADLGPGAPELLAAALASCLVHTYMVHAAQSGIPVDEIEALVECNLDFRGVLDMPGDAPREPTNIRYTLRVKSPEPPARLRELAAATDRSCPLLNALRKPLNVTARVEIAT